MHAIPREDGTHSQSTFLRIGATLSYTCFLVTGLLIWFSPRLDELYGYSGHWMTGFIIAGALLSAYGSVTRRWVGEFVGGPLLGTGLAVFGLETWIVLRADSPFLALAAAFLFVGVALFVVTRWRVVLAVYRFVHAVAMAERGMVHRER